MDEEKRHAQDLAKLGHAIREARERRGLSEREVADAVRFARWGAYHRGRQASQAQLRRDRASRPRARRRTGALFVRAESLIAE
jgi:transcriptional regulator with XRE-family HTH domain